MPPAVVTSATGSRAYGVARFASAAGASQELAVAGLGRRPAVVVGATPTARDARMRRARGRRWRGPAAPGPQVDDVVPVPHVDAPVEHAGSIQQEGVACGTTRRAAVDRVSREVV